MRRSRPTLAPSRLTLPLLALLLAAVPAAGSEATRTMDQEVALGGASAVQVKAPVADLKVVGDGGETVRVHVDLRCSSDGAKRCADAAQRVSLKTRHDGPWLVLEVQDFPRFSNHGLSADVRVTMPRALRLHANVGVGDVDIRSLENDIEIDTGVGDVDLTLPLAKVHSVELDTGVGDAELSVSGGTTEGTGLVGKHLDWSQEGGVAHVEVDSGVGDVKARLE
jgi:Toastrack DUF4097